MATSKPVVSTGKEFVQLQSGISVILSELRELKRENRMLKKCLDTVVETQKTEFSCVRTEFTLMQDAITMLLDAYSNDKTQRLLAGFEIAAKEAEKSSENLDEENDKEDSPAEEFPIFSQDTPVKIEEDTMTSNDIDVEFVDSELMQHLENDEILETMDPRQWTTTETIDEGFHRTIQPLKDERMMKLLKRRNIQSNPSSSFQYSAIAAVCHMDQMKRQIKKPKMDDDPDYNPDARPLTVEKAHKTPELVFRRMPSGRGKKDRDETTLTFYVPFFLVKHVNTEGMDFESKDTRLFRAGVKPGEVLNNVRSVLRKLNTQASERAWNIFMQSLFLAMLKDKSHMKFLTWRAERGKEDLFNVKDPRGDYVNEQMIREFICHVYLSLNPDGEDQLEDLGQKVTQQIITCLDECRRHLNEERSLRPNQKRKQLSWYMQYVPIAYQSTEQVVEAAPVPAAPLVEVEYVNDSDHLNPSDVLQKMCV